eukprot:4995060-Prymnesium_polylepis.1
MVTAAAGMFEAKEMQKILLQLLQSAGCSEELSCGCWRGAERAARVAARVCGGQSWAGERVCRGAARSRGVHAHRHVWRLLLWR